MNSNPHPDPGDFFSWIRIRIFSMRIRNPATSADPKPVPGAGAEISDIGSSSGQKFRLLAASASRHCCFLRFFLFILFYGQAIKVFKCWSLISQGRKFLLCLVQVKFF
jgi:hypothetical protein